MKRPAPSDAFERALRSTRAACALLGDTYKDKPTVVRDVYWSNRYARPPKTKRYSTGRVRTALAVLVLAFGPPGFAYLGAARLAPMPACITGSLLCCVLGLYLLMTIEENH